MDSHEKPLPSLEELQKKIEHVQDHAGMKRTGDPAEQPPRNAAGAMQVGVELVSGVAVGSFLGIALDKWLGTMPLFFIVCFFLGTAAGFKNLLRQAKGSADETER